jgi:hypothetical protein
MERHVSLAQYSFFLHPQLLFLFFLCSCFIIIPVPMPLPQPVESVTTRTTAYIRGLGPVESESATWNWQRSSLSVACMNQAW